MSVVQKIKDIEDELARTQKNKATMHHIGILKAKLSKLRKELLEPPKGSGGGPGGTRNIHIELTNRILTAFIFCSRL